MAPRIFGCIDVCERSAMRGVPGGRVLAVQRRLLLWFLVVRSEPGHSPCQLVSGTKYDGQHDYIGLSGARAKFVTLEVKFKGARKAANLSPSTVVFPSSDAS